MRILKHYDLNFDLTWPYVEHNLNWANTLSVQLLKLLDFKQGNFFTYLLPNTHEDIYQFKYSIFSRVINRKEMIKFITEYVKQNNILSCLFEDTLRSPTDMHLEEFHKYGLLYNREIYYLINQHNLNEDSISECLSASSAIWHSLCILTNAEINRKQPYTLTLDMINVACLKTKLAIIGAYDDEGYIFWEKSD